MENRAVKYRIYPDNDQRTFFLKTFGCCRKVWNLMLEDKISYYKETGKTLMTTPAQYKREYPFLKEVDSLALAKAQRKLRHKRTGSCNYKKQQMKIAEIYRQGANRRKDFLHKKSAEIANQHDIICVEDLDMKALSNKSFGNGKATMDNGYGMFVKMLEYKQRERGHLLVKVDKWYPSSQICSYCGARHKISLSERIYRCGCGSIIDRDLNAAINIRNEGLRMLAGASGI